SELSGIVRAVLAGGIEQLCTRLAGSLIRSRVHLDEERVRRILRDQPDLDGRACSRRLRGCHRDDYGHDHQDEDCRKKPEPPCSAFAPLRMAHSILPSLIAQIVVPITRWRPKGQGAEAASV